MRPVSSLADDLRKRGARTVALQFPAGLKRRGYAIAQELRREGFEVILSGDPCYGACDLALDTLGVADVLVHFGHAPVGRDNRVIFEPVSMDFDPAAVRAVLPLLRGPRVGLVTTVQHVHLLEAVAAELRRAGFEPVVAAGSGRTPHPGQVLGCSFRAARETGAGEILFVGTGLFHPLGVQLATGARVVALDPYTGDVTEVSAERFLRQRFGLIERARGGERIGIIVAAKSGQGRLELARRLAGLSEKAVLVMMREVTPEALLDLGCEAYVNTACPRLAYDDQARFPVPVLTPAEYEILHGLRSWEDYVADEWGEG
ncbi:MAG: diphthamide biosynthesis enzyme Dph2 [Methanomicrobiales archaeon]|nr:diphthamide biosynthesis enzyme Dph2 [Methanomicrobiales archaeon]